MSLRLRKMSLSELRAHFLERERIPSRELISRLAGDPRQGARRIADLALQRRRAADRERRRMASLLELERRLWKQGTEWVAGVDEVGVGPLAGPLVAAAVIFPPGVRISGIRDSKQLLPEQRCELLCEIRRQAVDISIAQATVPEIDRLNPYQAGLLAMRRAVQGLRPSPQHLLVDARSIPEMEIPQSSVIKGDQKHFSIAAASIVAKQWRDDLMCSLDQDFPGYGFARHKGYSTPQHQAAIRKLGPCEHHRNSYVFVRELSGNCSPSFYRFKDELEGLETWDDFIELKRQMQRALDLTPLEIRKLKVLLERCSRRIPRPSQMSFL